MIPGIYTDTVERHRAPDTAGIRAGRDWKNAARETLDGVYLQQSAAEADSAYEGTVTAYRLFGPVDLDLRQGDRVLAHLPGPTWLEVTADPVRVRSLFAPVAHSETTLRGINGR